MANNRKGIFNMKLKGFASVLTVSVLLLSVCGCQDNSNTYTEILSEEEIAARYSTTTTAASETTLPKTITENGITYIFDEATQLYLPEKTDTKQTTEEVIIEPVVYSPSEEILNADIYSGKVQIEDKVFTFPIKLQDLLDNGMVITEENITENYLVDPMDSKSSVDVTIGNVRAEIKISNKSDEMTFLKNCYASDIDFDNYDNVFYPCGVTVGISMEELTEKWGEPFETKTDQYDEDSIFYRYTELPYDKKRISGTNSIISITGNKYSVRFDRNTGLASAVFCVNGDNSDIAIKFSNEHNINIDGDWVDFCSNYFVPEYLSDGYHLIETDDGKYVLYFQSNLQSHAIYRLDLEPSQWNEEGIKKKLDSYGIESVEISDNTAYVFASDLYDENQHYYFYYENLLNYSFTFNVFPYKDNCEVTEEALEKAKEIILEIGKTITIE